MIKFAFGVFIIQLIVVIVLFALDHYEKTQVFKTKQDLFNALKPWKPYELFWKHVILPLADKFNNLS